jgi:hypothetical protein
VPKLKTNNKGAPAPKSNAERQQKLRESREAQGLKEVRGIYATEQNERLIKAYAKTSSTTSGRMEKRLEKKCNAIVGLRSKTRLQHTGLSA